MTWRIYQIGKKLKKNKFLSLEMDRKMQFCKKFSTMFKKILIFGDSSAGIKFKNLKLCPKGRDASNPPISALHLQLCSLGVFLRLFWTWGSSYDLEGRDFLKNGKVKELPSSGTVLFLFHSQGFSLGENFSTFYVERFWMLQYGV